MEWRVIEGFENYEINTIGEVRSKPREGTKGGILKQFLDRKKDGYLQVHIYRNGKAFYPLVHRLMVNTFLPKIEGKTYVNHKNGIKTDNRLENLEWCSCRENILHANDNGLVKRRKVQQYDKNGNLIATFPNSYRASTITKIAFAGIYWCLKGKHKTAGGFVWKYID